MSFSEFFANLKRYDENAAIIFDCAEPIGQPTDLVMPRRRWFRRAVVARGVGPGFSQEKATRPQSTPPAPNS